MLTRKLLSVLILSEVKIIHGIEWHALKINVKRRSGRSSQWLLSRSEALHAALFWLVGATSL